jgi:hypothetical protein
VGFFQVVESGTVRCGSVLVAGPWFPEVASYLRHHGDVDLGVHLCLNSEFSSYRWRPLSGARAVPTLVDSEGYFWASPSETLQSADPEEVRTELRSQIEHAVASGVDVTHLDAHMGTAMMQKLFPVYVSLGLEYRIPLFLPRPTPTLLEEVGRSDMIDTLDEVLESFESSGVLMIDHAELRSLCFDPDRAEEHYRKVLAELQPGVTHMLIHPALDDDELRAITPESWRHREAERRIFSGADVRRWLDEAGIVVIGYRPIRDLLRAS